MDKKCCGNCAYFSGKKGDGMQICCNREGYVHESSYCSWHALDLEKEESNEENIV